MRSVRIRITRPFGENNKRASLRVGAFYSQKDVGSICSEARDQGFRCTTIRDVVTDVPNIATSRPTKKKYLSPLEAVEIPGYKAPSSSQPVPENAPSSMPAESSQNQKQTLSYNPDAVSVTGTDIVTGQWIELGVFESTQAAWDQWKALQQRVGELASFRPVISGSLGANGSGKYKLRSGPFATDVDAENACKTIIKQGDSCSVAEPF